MVVWAWGLHDYQLGRRRYAGEYSGELSEWDALIPGQPNQALKQNSGYTLRYNAKSVRKKFVYVMLSTVEL
ncbi:hypothetical protein PI124_g10672 [Phytophthora idaei]|nr:hypothetical protein PI125_g13078 [Phytophthora idaei]KAG3140003.1 hypothetical protein PI126_g16220 [Phytophthora idaei]KAG3244547.1 hypothetical protein PI124_g10672 [Phytophthora idaei]